MPYMKQHLYHYNNGLTNMPSTISFSDKEWEIIYAVCDILLIPFKLVYSAIKNP